MAILESDLKLVHAVEDSQFDTGAGPLTATEIQDGNIGEILEPIDEVSASIGRVFIYKGGAVVDTATAERLQNAFLFLSEVPDDPLLVATLTSTGDAFDRLPAIRSYVETYYSASTPWAGYFYGTQAAGMMSIVLVQRPGTALPDVGGTFAIIMDEGQSTEQSEYVVVTSVTSETDAFTYNGADFTKQIVTVNLQNRLTYTYPGSPVTRDDPTSPRTVFKRTFVAPRARYYGMAKTTAAVAPNTLTVMVDSIFNQIVPTANSISPLVDLSASGTKPTLVVAGSVNTLGMGVGARVLYVGMPVVPGSLSISCSFGTLTDDGAGTTYINGVTSYGTIDYATGKLTNTHFGVHDFFYTLQFRPAALVQAPAQTANIPVTSLNQWTGYTITLPTQPRPGTLEIYYRAQGNDYRLADRGDGICVGYDSSYGTAKLSFETRSVLVSLTTLPDVDTFMLFAWGVSVYTFDRSSATLGKAYLVLTTAAALPPSGFSISWNDGTAHTATDDGVGNIVSSAATGKVFYADKTVWLMPNTLPPPGTDFVFAITPRLAATETFSPLAVDPGTGISTLTLAHTNLQAKSLRLTFTAATDVETVDMIAWTKDSLYQSVSKGPALAPANAAWAFTENASNGITGLTNVTINHTDGILAFKPQWQQDVRVPQINSNFNGSYYRNTFQSYAAANHLYQGTACTVSYYYGDAASTVTEHVLGNTLTVDVTPGLSELILPGSLSFTLCGKRVIDQDYKLYADVDTTTGAGTLVGSLNPMTGDAQLTTWTSASNTPALLSCATRAAADIVDEITFRSPGSPVASTSVQITATDTDGNTLTATADGAGAISATGLDGKFFYNCGIGSVRFGDWVTASFHTAAPWYHASDVVGGLILKPRQVIASSIRFNCGIVSHMPMDADIIKIDPNRLPGNGLIPKIQKGNWLLIHHTEATTATASAGGTVDLGRTGLERVWVRDADGKHVFGTQFSVVLATGIFTWAAPLSLGGYSSPFTIYNRKMHKSRATRVDISGRVDLEYAPLWTIPEGACVSSALLLGDLQGRVALMFTQGSWDTNHMWMSATPNTTPSAQYNQLEYPILVTNQSNTDSYALVFTDSTHYKIISKGRGELATGIATSADYTLVDSVTSHNEFTIYHLGFGTGWIPGNVIRMDITGGKAVWDLVLSCLPGDHASLTVDRLTLEFAGGI